MMKEGMTCTELFETGNVDIPESIPAFADGRDDSIRSEREESKLLYAFDHNNNFTDCFRQSFLSSVY